MFRSLLLIALGAGLLPWSPAEAQFGRRIREAAARAAEREATRQVERAAERAVRCVVTDEACITEAKRQGKPVDVVPAPRGETPATPAVPPAQAAPAVPPASAPATVTTAGRTPASLVTPMPGPLDSALARSARGADAWYRNGEGRLTDALLPLLVALLEAEIRDADQGIQQRAGTYAGPRLRAEFERAIPAFEEGRLDPLEWIESVSRKVPVPPGATYVPGCSRYITRLKIRKLWPMARQMEHLNGRVPQVAAPVAVFTFGMPAGGMADRIFADPSAKPAQPGAPTMNMIGDEAHATVRRAVAFLARNGIRENRSDDFARDGLAVWVLPHSAEPGSLPTRFAPRTNGGDFEPTSADARSCGRLTSGPILLAFVEALPGEMPGSHRAALLSRLPVADNTLIVLYQEASRVADYLTDPAGSVLEGLEGPEADSRFSPGELATYRHNLAWYRRHAARLDPLFARRDQ